MDINNNQQTNTFIKGMDTDTSDMYMGEGSYRYAENLRVVTDEDSNSGELHIIEGTNKVFTIIPEQDTNEYVDLGLPSGIKWATCNLGATNPYDYGLYYSWGNVDGHILGENGYSFSDLTYSNSIGASLHEEIPTDAIYDAAINEKGSGWRIPKKDDFLELLEYTTSEWVANYLESGIPGTLFTASNGNSIFLPAAGYYKVVDGNNQSTTPIGSPDLYGMYWTSSYSNFSPNNAYEYSPSRDYGVLRNLSSRARGCSIRPVYNKSFGNFAILGYTTIRNYILVIVKRTAVVFGQQSDEWAIFRYDADNNFEKALVAGWFTKRIWPTDNNAQNNWNGKTKPLSLVTRYESSNNIKLYIANGETELLSINIAPGNEYNSGKSFEDVFGTIKTNLLPIVASVSKNIGAQIPGVILLYGYVLYKVNGTASTLSVLSNTVIERVDAVHGYNADEQGGHPVNLTMPTDVLNKYIRVYRVAYSKAGQLPRVDIIYDQECNSENIIDSGQSLYNLSASEFIATNTLLFVPGEIESKGDYLFAGNVKYSQDDIDEQFKDFDARCYSYGNYYYDNGQRINIRNDASDELLLSLEQTIDLHHELFDNNTMLFDKTLWQKNSDGYNGHGLCFDWKYVYDTKDLYFTEQCGTDSSNNYVEVPKTYARNEVYRFGVRLFDAKGNQSSVKWIADIKMPDYFAASGDADTKDYIEEYSSDYDRERKIKTNSISIEFTPRNLDKECWRGISKYEIVLARRSISDSFKVTQGIVGYPMVVDSNEKESCLPYFLTMQLILMKSGVINLYGTVYGDAEFSQDKKHLVFCSPEYSYQPDDVLSILKTNTVRYKEIVHLSRKASNYGDESNYILGYLNTGVENPLLTQNSTDLHIQASIIENSSPTEVVYSLTSITMLYNHNRSPLIKYEPLNGNRGKDARKNVFFTNMYAQSILRSCSNDLAIRGIRFNEPQEDNLAKDELPTYRSLFKTLPNGDKFYNWTNPAMLRKWMYDKFTSGGDQTKEGWKECTMTSYESSDLGSKYFYEHPTIGARYQDEHALEASSALMFPMSAGGPNIVLEFNNNVSSSFGTYSLTNMPAITVANIYQVPTPYGGYNVTARNNTQYISQGFYSSPNGEALKVSMGDNTITMFVYCLYHSIDNAVHNDIQTGAVQYIVPIESTIDLSKQCSNYLQATSSSSSNIRAVGDGGAGVWVQAKPSTVAGRFTLTTDMYMYNTAYSITPDIITYAGQDTVNQANPTYDSRIHYSLRKQNNELIDNWTTFKSIDYLDVDSRYGQITGLKLFKDKLVFLQENGAGILSVNDRIILKDLESANIIVGNGGVLDRYDYFTTIYGMKPDQHVIEASNDALYWWDGYRKEVIGYTDGYNVNLLQRIKNVANYINNGTESDAPSIVYDANNKEVLFNVVNNKCITYNEQIQQFTSVYTFNPIYYSNIDGKIYLTDQWVDKEHLYEYNQYNEHDEDGPKLFEEEHHPTLKYVVNKEPTYNKVFDIQTFGGRFYKGHLDDIQFDYYTPLKQHSWIRNGEGITDREYDYRLAIPRNNDDVYGGRMRGKTMECVLTSSSNDKDFSIQYVTTKYRMSWS